MPYAVVPLTVDQVANGALFELLRLSDLSIRRAVDQERRGQRPREQCIMTIFALNSSIGVAFQNLRNRFGAGAFQILLLNECAVVACHDFGIPVPPAGQIADDELPAEKAWFLYFPYYR